MSEETCSYTFYGMLNSDEISKLYVSGHGLNSINPEK